MTNPVLLIPAGVSPHAFALKPSTARALENADIVVRIGPGLETVLNRSITNLPKESKVVNLVTAEGVKQWPYRHRDLHERHGGHSHGGHAHGHQTTDPHIWLDVENARAIITVLADLFARALPDHAGEIAANAEKLRSRLAQLHDAMREKIQPLTGVPFIILHDAYRYFEERYGLKPRAIITVSPDRLPGARHLRNIKKLIRQAGVACVFSEPQFDLSVVKALTEGTSARSGSLDPLGATLSPGPALYFDLMNRLVDGYSDCLAPPGDTGSKATGK